MNSNSSANTMSPDTSRGLGAAIAHRQAAGARRPRELKPAARCASKRRASAATAIGALIVTATALARDDQVVIDGRSYLGAQITELKNGRLHFVQATGQQKTPWLADVESLFIDRSGPFVDFNEAEKYLEQGEFDRAIERYRRAALRADEFWPELIEARILTALHRAGRLRDGVRAYLRVVSGLTTGPAVAARMMPEVATKGWNREVSQALVELDEAIMKTSAADRKAMLLLLRYDMRRRLGEAPKPGAASAVGRLAIPVHARTQRVYEIKLDAMTHALKQEPQPRMTEAIDEAIRTCPKKILPKFLLFKGKALLGVASNRDDLIRASWPLFRVVVHMAGTVEAAEGLYQAAVVMEKLNRPNKAIAMLEECLEHPRADESTKENARAALERLRASAKGRG